MRAKELESSFSRRELELLVAVAGDAWGQPEDNSADPQGKDDQQNSDDPLSGLVDENPLQETSEDLPGLEVIDGHIRDRFANLASSEARKAFHGALHQSAATEWGRTKFDLVETAYFKYLAYCLWIDSKTLERILHKLSTIKADREVFASFLEHIPYGIIRPVAQDISGIRRRLDSAVLGMREAKQGVIENLVLYLHSSGKSAPTPLLLVGPPGTGKTALGHSVAAALGLPFAKFSLASAYDAMMLRGSSPGWRNASPGLILKELIHAACLNPVWLWDELDKAGGSSAGLVQDVLTEVLDHQMACEYRDTFLEMPIDLSRVVNIATANSIEAIPAYIRDRCNVVHIEPYSLDEKIAIIRHYMPEQLIAEMLLPCRIIIPEGIAGRIAVNSSLRAAKRILRSLIARQLEGLRPGGIDELIVELPDDSILHEDERRIIGFRGLP